MAQRILVVSHDRALEETRAAILRSRGYAVESVSSDDEAVAVLSVERFDLVVLGRNSHLSPVALDQRLRAAHPDIVILKIASSNSDGDFSSRHTGSQPKDVLQAVREMLQ